MKSSHKSDAPEGPLVDAAWLVAHLGDKDLRVLDMRWYLSNKKGFDEYARGHIPGAVFIDLDKDVSAPVGPGRHPIPSPEQFQRAMRRAGVSKRSRVVVYDDVSGGIAARLWWLLRQFGHSNTQLLDGGYPAWIAAGGAVETEAASPIEGDFVAQSRNLDVVDRHMVEHLRNERRVRLLDARSPERYRGEVEPIDARPGHIPNALNAPWADNLVDGRFADPTTLRARYRDLGVRNGAMVLCYCGSGVTACHDLLALSLAGVTSPPPMLYEGSWSEWARDPDRPAKLGPEP